MRHRFAPGQVIIREGEISCRAFLILAGRVRVTRHQDNHEIQLAELTTNDIFGEMSIIDRKPRSASVTAIVTTDCVELNLNNLKSIMTQSPNTSIVIFRALCAKLRDSNNRITQGFSTEEISFWYRAITVCRLWYEATQQDSAMRQNLDNLRRELAAALGFSMVEVQPVVNKLIACDMIGEPREESGSIVHMDVIEEFLNCYDVVNVTEKGHDPLTQEDLQVCDDILEFAESRLPRPDANQLIVPSNELKEALMQNPLWTGLPPEQQSHAYDHCFNRLASHGLLGFRFKNRQEIILIVKRLRALMSLDIKPGGEYDKTCRHLLMPT